ncbi:hypothetical protein K7B10_07595 [Streptomyces flavotricini]|uniref:Uncharacterized protein n=1 Tax=Streptomyces flavotricini TaxID=66888 RepID=A0ABS8E124_9ACTN|nr:hypothetical protein [Streptomyces flavotricini]MCC0094648.1 hypothetical protein [Streptomyces flavotricini]
MARIRTIKPEMFLSEDVASVDISAMVTFIGLLTQADDNGRFLAHPAIIAGFLWALRAEHTPEHVANDLEQLEAAGLICRYIGCDGKKYLHIVTWEKHQKIDRPSASRVSRCPKHQTHQRCGGCTAEKQRPCPVSQPAAVQVPATPAGITGPVLQASAHPRRALDHPVSPASALAAVCGAEAAGGSSSSEDACETLSDAAPAKSGESPAQGAFVEPSTQTREGSSSGSRILDPGSSPKGGDAPVHEAAPGPDSTKALVAEYVSSHVQRPPKDVIGLVGRHVKGLLEEGFDAEVIRAALERLRFKNLHPSVLPSLVNEALNAAPPHAAAGVSSASGAGAWAHASGYTPYMNPTTPEPTTFGGSL